VKGFGRSTYRKQTIRKTRL